MNFQIVVYVVFTFFGRSAISLNSKQKRNRKSKEKNKKRKALYRRSEIIKGKDELINSLQNDVSKMKADLFKAKKHSIKIPPRRFGGGQQRQTSAMITTVPKASSGKVSGFFSVSSSYC